MVGASAETWPGHGAEHHRLLSFVPDGQVVDAEPVRHGRLVQRGAAPEQCRVCHVHDPEVRPPGERLLHGGGPPECAGRRRTMDGDGERPSRKQYAFHNNQVILDSNK